MTKKIDVIYSPSTGKVACVLLQAAFGADRSVCHLFPTDDWDVAPRDTMRRSSGTMEDWKQLAAMSRQERVSAYEALRGDTA